MLLNNFPASLVTGVESKRIPLTSIFNVSTSLTNASPIASSLPGLHSYEKILSDELSKKENTITVESVNILPSQISPTEEAPMITDKGKSFKVSIPA